MAAPDLLSQLSHSSDGFAWKTNLLAQALFAVFAVLGVLLKVDELAMSNACAVRVGLFCSLLAVAFFGFAVNLLVKPIRGATFWNDLLICVVNGFLLYLETAFFAVCWPKLLWPVLFGVFGTILTACFGMSAYMCANCTRCSSHADEEKASHPAQVVPTPMSTKSAKKPGRNVQPALSVPMVPLKAPEGRRYTLIRHDGGTFSFSA